MKWTDEFNTWRVKYDDMTYQEQQIFYDNLFKYFPHQSQHTKELVKRFFNNIPIRNIHVLELGGWNGELAREMLRIFKDKISSWDNYEISQKAKEKNVCFDERYNIIIPNDFVWNIILPEHYNIFLSAHTIEHIRAIHFQKLIENLPKTIEWIYFEAPLPLKHGRHWMNDYSTHILEWGWKDIEDFMLMKGFYLTDLGRDVRIYKRSNE